MITTLKKLVTAARETHDLRGEHDLSLDIIDSLLRLLSIVAITAYRNEGAKETKVNRVIAQQLPWPSMGSWKNFLDALSKSEPSNFPDDFHDRFLSPLRKDITEKSVTTAFGYAQGLIEHAQSSSEEKQKDNIEAKCSAIQFFDAMVSYRNLYIGHGSQVMTDPIKIFVPFLKKGVISLCQNLRPLWLHYPIYVAKRGSQAGATFHNLVPLSEEEGIREIHSADDSVIEDRLYVNLGKANAIPASLYPAALWHEGDILFVNGAKDYKQIKYLGYVNHAMMTTNVHEKAFCSYISPFMGVKSLNTIDLADARALAQAMDLRESGWTFPRFKKDAIVGSEDSQYRLVSRLGRGGMAEVWKAVSLRDKKEVAIKFLLDPMNAARFRREARTLARTSTTTDRVVKYIDFQFDPHPSRMVAFLVMELLPGDSLQDLAKKPEAIVFEDTLNWMEDAIHGLQAIHDVGAVHRDVKPANLMFDRNRRVKLGDLGLVGEGSGMESELLTTVGLTQDGIAIGTFEFSAPEQLEGGKDGTTVGPKADLFSLGATFYYLLTGLFPYGMGNQTLITKKHLEALNSTQSVKPVKTTRNDCPEGLDALIMSMINVDPDLRPQDTKSILSLIENIRENLRNENANINLNLLGDVGTPGLKFENLIPTWCSRFLFKLWPVVMAAQWLLVIVLSRIKGTWFQIDLLGLGFDPGRWSKLHPFFKDYMFMVWNLLPFLLIALLYRVLKIIQPLMKNVYEMDANKKGNHWASSAKRNDFWARLIKNKWVLAGTICISMYSAFIQIKKMGKFQSTGEMYWWDWKISKATWLVREFALIFDMIGLVLMFIIIVALIDIISYILRGTKMSIDLHHSDGANGLSSVGGLLTVFLPFFSAISINAVIGTIDHRGQIINQIISDWATICFFSFLFFFLFLWPILPIRRQIVSFVDSEVKRFSKRRRLIEGKLRKLLDQSMDFSVEQANQFKVLSGLADDLQIAEKQCNKTWIWPITKKTALALVLFGLAPLALALLFTRLIP